MLENLITKCIYPKCKSEDVLTWLGKPLCQKHWEWVCSVDRVQAIAKLGPLVGNKEEGLCSVCSPQKADAVVRVTQIVPVEEIEVQIKIPQETSEEQNLSSKKAKQPYTDEIDKQLKELRSQNLPIGQIAKAIGRSYASTMYRIRFLENK